MKKNISLTHALLLLPLLAPSALLSMEKELSNNNNQNPMAESVIVIPAPTTRGLGIVRTLKNNATIFGWSAEENIYNDLKNKTFDINNSSYHHQLDTAIQIYSTNKNSQRVTEILALCRENYPRNIKIGDGQAQMAHTLLTEENKNRQASLKKTLEAKDKEFIAQENDLLTQLKESINQHVIKMEKLYTAYLDDSQKEQCVGERTTYIQQECDEIRNLKTGLINLHKLNKQFILDGYCSDNEKDIKTPANIKNSYNDAHILEKIKITEKMNATQQQINDLLVTLTLLKSKICEITPLQY